MTEADRDSEGVTEALSEIEGEKEADTEMEGEAEALRDMDGLPLDVALPEGDFDSSVQAAQQGKGGRGRQGRAGRDCVRDWHEDRGRGTNRHQPHYTALHCTVDKT